MSRNLPPLPALQAFEATARLGTMTLAAEELHLSQVAISKRVSNLEKFTRTQLFIRGGRKLQLSSDGEKLYLAANRAFHDIQNTLEEFDDPVGHRTLSVSGYTTFTMRWLLPRLPRFKQCYPDADIDIRLTTSLADIDFERSTFDGAIRYGKGDWAGCRMLELAPVELVPVCTPEMAEKLAAAGPEALKDITLLHSVVRPRDWHIWLQGVGVSAVDAYKGTTFNNSSIAYEGAYRGLGVAMSQKILVEEDVRAGRLAFPFAPTIASGESYWFVWPNSNQSVKLRCFRQWLASEVRAPRSMAPGQPVGPPQ